MFKLKYLGNNYTISWFIPNERYPTYNFDVRTENKVILDWEYWPNNVTPENIENKLKAWLLFK